MMDEDSKHILALSNMLMTTSEMMASKVIDDTCTIREVGRGVAALMGAQAVALEALVALKRDLKRLAD